jgi:putative ubiquitin-RnfH superfamily antitoxin RatB of RatAB toxin-antitoxin module
MELPADIGVEVTYAEPHRAIVKAYRLAPPATIDDALRLAAADPEFAGIDFAGSAVGIFGRVAAQGQMLADGDRVEIYRPLAADPKSARRARAREARRTTGSPRPR